MKTELPPEPVRSCPHLNWLLKPGEAVRYFKQVVIRGEWSERFVEVSAAEAYRIAERCDQQNR